MKTISTTIFKVSIVSALLVLSSITTVARADHDNGSDSVLPYIAVGVIASILHNNSRRYHYKKRYHHGRHAHHGHSHGHRIKKRGRWHHGHYASHREYRKYRRSFSDDGYRHGTKRKHRH